MNKGTPRDDMGEIILLLIIYQTRIMSEYKVFMKLIC